MMDFNATASLSGQITVPPVNSIDRCRPRVARKNTAATKVNAEMALNTSAWRMKGMSLRMRKNSMIFQSFPLSGFPSRPAWQAARRHRGARPGRSRPT